MITRRPFPNDWFCIFYSENGLCLIHNMKPLEGRMAHHSPVWAKRYDRQTELVDLWCNDAAQQIVLAWKILFERD
jgi:hypothetical protein